MSQSNTDPLLPSATAETPGLWDEDLYQATSSVLVEPPLVSSAWRGVGCLVITLVLFVLSFFWSIGLRALGFVIPVLLLHEAGHFIGMRLFGYRNVQMFFVPFFGAAVSGKKHAAPVWQQAVVLLLGPLPGLLLALALQLGHRPPSGSWAGELIVWLVVINGINLLPVVPLDGGRIVDVLLFARRPWLAVAFRLLAVALLLLAAWKLDAWIFGLVGVLLLLGTAGRYRKARLESAFRDNPFGLPERLEELSDSQRRELFGWAMLLNPMDGNPTSLASDMRTLHEHMVSRRPGPGVWSLLVALYLGGFVVSFATMALSRQHTAAHVQRQVEMLVTDYRATLDHLDRLRREEQQARDPDQVRRLTSVRERAWQEMVARWKQAPNEVQTRAVVQLLINSPRGASDHSPAVLRLMRELEITLRPPSQE